MAVSWQVSATYLQSMIRACRALGHEARLLAKVSPETKAMLVSPHAQAWWPGDVLIDCVGALGVEAGNEVSIRASRDGMGPLVKPLVGVLLALTKSPIRALIDRLDTFVSAGVKGVKTNFTPNAEGNGGEVTFTFPEPVIPEMATAWTGLFDVGFSLARSGRVVSQTIEGAVHRFIVAW
jgi:hypothetical protein